MFDQVFWRAISGQINRWRRNVLHLGNTSLDRMQPHKIPFLYNFSPTVVPPTLDWPEWIHVTGRIEFILNGGSLSQVTYQDTGSSTTLKLVPKNGLHHPTF
jgi:hypothetical protein